MKCRRIDPDTNNIVWFGVKGVEEHQDEEGNTYVTPIFVDDENKHDNYAEGAEAVANSLRQRLSVIKNELWYDYENGMPLIDKVRSKSSIDAYIIKTVLAHDDVLSIDGMESEVVNHVYSCYLEIATTYGSVEVGL